MDLTITIPSNVMATIEEINEFAQEQIAELLAYIQEQRFKNQGEFLDHEKWEDNDNLERMYSVSVQTDKGRNSPLIDTGRLMKQMTSVSNWEKEVKKQQNGLQTKFNIPTREHFNDPIYDKLDKGFHADPYTSIRGNRVFWAKRKDKNGNPIGKGANVPARPFKDTSETDIAWVTQQLTQRIQARFGNG